MARPVRPINQKSHSRQIVLEAILRSPGISRTALAQSVGLNTATISRIARAMIQAGLVVEADMYGPSDRPGRRFVGLKPRSEGGFAIGIAINAFRQTVTLADFNNSKISEWNSAEVPGPDGEQVLQRCLTEAAKMVKVHITDRRRLFGVGIAVAGEIDAQRGQVLSAPILGWNRSVNASAMVKNMLDVPLVLSTPPNAMNAADADIGSGQGVKNLLTLNCSLGYGVAFRRLAATGAAITLGRVVAESKAPGCSNLQLSHVCGGQAILRRYYGVSKTDCTPKSQLGPMLVRLIEESNRNEALQILFRDTGGLAASHLALIIELCQPDRLLLVGPMTESSDFVESFRAGLTEALGRISDPPEVHCSDMTPQRASRWLALKGNLAAAVQKLDVLTSEDAA